MNIQQQIEQNSTNILSMFGRQRSISYYKEDKLKDFITEYEKEINPVYKENIKEDIIQYEKRFGHKFTPYEEKIMMSFISRNMMSFSTNNKSLNRSSPNNKSLKRSSSNYNSPTGGKRRTIRLTKKKRKRRFKYFDL